MAVLSMYNTHPGTASRSVSNQNWVKRATLGVYFADAEPTIVTCCQHIQKGKWTKQQRRASCMRQGVHYLWVCRCGLKALYNFWPLC